jgi:protein-disulfide isomerase
MRTIPGSIILLMAISASSSSLLGQKKKEPEQTLATVNGEVITETQVRKDSAEELEMLELQQLKEKAVAVRKVQEILEKHLNSLIEEKLLEAESAKRGVTKPELLASEVQSKVKEPTAEEIDSIYKINAERIKQPKEAVEPQIRNALKRRETLSLRRELIQRLEKDYGVTRVVTPLRFKVDVAGRPFLGPAEAPITMVVFSDFECPYCKEFSSTIKEAKEQYGNKMRLVFRQFPLTAIHPNAQKAAEASLCAAGQNKFWEMHDLLFKDQSSLSAENLKNKAKELGLDVAAFDACLDGGQSATLVHQDIVAAFSAGVEGTPATFVNGRFINGNASIEDLIPIIDDELARQALSNKRAPSGAAQK